MINYPEIEKKWQKAWADAKIYEPEPNEKESFIVTFAFPYVNSPLHAGHMKTYSLTDSYARYLRMKGYNTLLPTGFHMTGTPILGMSKRLANKDPELIKDFREIYGIPDAEIEKMKDPLYLARYFAADAEAGLKEAGLGIDWRRKFNSIDPHFSKFVEWQFLRMKEKGLLTQGTHPVAWCTNESNAIGGHDTKGDVQPNIEELIAIKFKDSSSDVYFPCATYRPETIYGVTNLFIKDDVVYSIVEIDGVQYYLSKDAVFELSHQFDVKLKGEIPAKDLLAKKAINPVTKEEVPILPGFFVKLDVGTGIVMSVPAHAPFDYAALERLKTRGYPVPPMQYKKIIDVEKGGVLGKTLDPTEKKGSVMHPEIPALAFLELLSINPDAVDDMLEIATKAIYKEESHHGVMLVGDYAGKPEPQARDGLKKDLQKSKQAFQIYVISNELPVICRCGTRAIVKVVSDQWFINYGDKKWKDIVRKILPNTKIFPEKLRPTYEYLIDWLDLRATERAQGLGTSFPFNPSHIIESLSDSTIYQLFYTFVHILDINKVTPEQLKPEFFDYIVSSIGDVDSVAKPTGIDASIVQKCKQSFDYWYVNTSNHSGSDLINNHLIMSVFVHAMMLPEKNYQKQVVANGLLMFEGQKMSKSLGNTMPVRGLFVKYGADPMRFSSIATADLDSETNFSEDTMGSVRQKNEFLMNSVDTLNTMNGIELEHIDYWLYSRLNSKIADATKHMDDIEFRSAYTEILYGSITDLKWYLDRGGKNQMVVRELLESVALMLSPIMPHFAEEMWHMLGNTTLAAQSRWPTSNTQMINKNVEQTEEIISGTIEDINSAIALTSKMDANKGKKIKSITIIMADDWKKDALNMLIEKKEMSAVINEAKFSGIEKEKLSKFLSQFMSKLQTLQKLPEITGEELYTGFLSSRDYMKRRLNADIVIEKESASQSARATRAMPNKPSIDVAWG
jgi:leucyl-tRNA synthetase